MFTCWCCAILDRSCCENSRCSYFYVKKNEWLIPKPVNDVPYLLLKEIKCQPKPTSQSSSTKPHEYVAGAAELLSFYKELSHCSKKPIVLSVIAPYNETFVQSVNHLPKPLQNLYDSAHLKLSFTQTELAQQYKVNVTPAMRDHVEDITRFQSLSRKWFKYRAGRVTASTLHAVVYTNQHQPSISILKCICYPELNSLSQPQPSGAVPMRRML